MKDEARGGSSEEGVGLRIGQHLSPRQAGGQRRLDLLPWRISRMQTTKAAVKPNNSLLLLSSLSIKGNEGLRLPSSYLN